MGSSVLQKRVDELEAHQKKLEEEKASLKQENASLVSFRGGGMLSVACWLVCSDLP